MDFAELIGAKAYVSINVGTGSPRDMSQWIEYITADGHSSLAQERRANGRDKPWKLDYVGIGNEMWGCGGSMRPQFYADVYNQYATFVHAPPNAPITRIASGANAGDVQWTDSLMAAAGSQIDAISLHNYSIPTGDWKHKGSATQFGEDQWISTLQGALGMDDLITRHSQVMDKYDPKRRVALAVDEWGNWTDQDPDAGDAVLYQQNSLRDALSAAITLDIFQAHADRVRMANIAQMVNVLQAMILTDKTKMVLTPTYYVFVALVNLDPHLATTVHIHLVGPHGVNLQGKMLTAPAITSVNTFNRPHEVRPVSFEHAVLKDDVIAADLSPKSIVVLEIR